MLQIEVWAAVGTKYSPMLGKLQIKLLLSAVASEGSFLFLLITFVPPLLPTANCSISALKKNYFGDWIFSQGIYPDHAVHTFITADCGNLPTRTSCSDTNACVLKATKKFIQLNIDRFFVVKKKKKTGRLKLYLHAHKKTCILLLWVIFGAGLLPGCQLFLFTSCLKRWLSINFQGSRIQPILLFSFFLECEKVCLGYSTVLHLWQFIITPINMPPGDSKNKTEGCRKREELAQSLWARCIQLSSRSYNCTFESAHTAPSDQGNCSCRTGARISCELFGSSG